jgi:hypothetical protein
MFGFSLNARRFSLPLEPMLCHFESFDPELGNGYAAKSTKAARVKTSEQIQLFKALRATS